MFSASQRQDFSCQVLSISEVQREAQRRRGAVQSGMGAASGCDGEILCNEKKTRKA